MKRKLITELSFQVKLTFRALRHGYTYSGNTTITWREQGDIFTPVWHEFQTTTGSTGVFPLIDIDNLVQTRWIKNITLYCTFCTHLTYDNNRLAEYLKKKKDLEQELPWTITLKSDQQCLCLLFLWFC